MLLKTQTPQKAAANLAAYNNFIDRFVANIEKKSKLKLKFQEDVNDISIFLNSLSKPIEKQL